MTKSSPKGFQIVILVFRGMRTCTVRACSIVAKALSGSYDGKYVAYILGSPDLDTGLPWILSSKIVANCEVTPARNGTSVSAFFGARAMISELETLSLKS